MPLSRSSSEAPRAKKRKKEVDDDAYRGRSSKAVRAGSRYSRRLKKVNFLTILPAETRNEIYEYALIEDGVISIKRNYPLPGLLRACRQARWEGSKMYWHYNKFKIDIQDYDVSLWLDLKRLPWWPTFYWLHSSCVMDTGDSIPVWSNARVWLQAIHSGALSVPSVKLGPTSGRRARAAWNRFMFMARAVYTYRVLTWPQIIATLDASGIHDNLWR